MVEHYKLTYAGQMQSCDRLMNCMNTCAAYEGLTHPMTQQNGRWMPNFRTRYLTEDLPMSVSFIRGVGEIFGVAMPVIDKVMYWAQDKIDMEILVDGHMEGKDISKTSAPQAAGADTVDKFLKMSALPPYDV